MAMHNSNRVAKSFKKVNTNYAYTKEGSSVFFAEKEKNFSGTQPKSIELTGIKSARSPNVRLIAVIVIGVVTALAVIGGIVAAVLLIGNDSGNGKDSDEFRTTTPLYSTTHPVTTTSSGLSVSTRSDGTSTISGTMGTTTNAPATDSTTTDYSLSTMTTLDSTTTETPLPAFWLSWNSWTSCSVTCGSGVHRRYRSCSDTDSFCEGDYIDTGVCTENACPVYGKWTTWSSWGSCTTTCGGGTQLRTRSCNTTDPTDHDCVGNDNQTKTCSTWNCPDCSQTCTVGVLHSACDTCICENTMTTVRVVSKTTGYFIVNAFVYASTAPTTLLTTSNNTGYFTLNATCVSSELLIVREGYVDATVTVDGSNVEVTMTKIVLPYFSQTPRSKYRLSGEEVTLCCSATASPNVTYFEWFKDTLLIDTVYSSNETMITLRDLTPSDSGNYQCRANSPYGALKSPVARLDVKENPDDFCENSLQQKLISLPEGCVNPDTNDTTYEVGECAPHKCKLNDSSPGGSCANETYSCCAASQVDMKTLQCADFEIQLFVIRACSCAECVSPTLQISGKALDTVDNSPVRYAEVWANGEFQTYTGSSGGFIFQPSDLVDSVTISIVDTFLQQYLPTTKKLDIVSYMTGTVNIEIRMFKASDPIEIDSSVENTLVVGTTDGGSAIVQIDIPSNAFYDADGIPYSGTVSASLTFLDPTNITILKNIPGLFEFTDAEGEQGALDSYGVFNLYFRGSDGQELVLDSAIDLYAPTELVSGVEGQDIKLWRLNTETGVWDYVNSDGGVKRRKRQASRDFIASIDPSEISERQWWNYDMIRYETNPCYFKMRLFENYDAEKDEFKLPISLPPSRIDVDLVTLANRRLRKTYYSFNDPENTCLFAICDDGDTHIFAHGFVHNKQTDLFAAKPYQFGSSSLEYTISEQNKALRLKIVKSSDGPFFENQDVCLQSSSSDSHIRFHYGLNTENFIVKETFIQPVPPPPLTNEIIAASRLTWYPDRDEGYRVCYLKVRLDFIGDFDQVNDFNFKLKTMSFGGTHDAVLGQVFGIKVLHIETIENNTYCIEFKCSGSMHPYFPTESDMTKVKVLFEHPLREMECIVTSSTNLAEYEISGQNGPTGGVYEFMAPPDNSANLGIYWRSSQGDLEGAKTNAENACYNGDSLFVPGFNPLLGVGITFTCRQIACGYWWDNFLNMFFYNNCDYYYY